MRTRCEQVISSFLPLLRALVARELVEKMNNSELLKSGKIDVIYTYEPTDGYYGSQIKKILRGERKPKFHAEKLLLFILDRADHVEKVIRPNLERGNIVVVDRYIHSNLAYQFAEGFSLDLIEFLNKDFPPPHLVIYLDCDPKIAIRRIEPRYYLSKKEIYDKQDFLELVRASYEFVLRRGMFIEYDYIVFRTDNFDADKVVKQSYDFVMKFVKRMLR